MTARLPEELDAERLNRDGRRNLLTDANRERYRELRARKLCTRNEEHGPAEEGKSLCAACLIDCADAQAKYYRKRVPVTRRNSCLRCTREGHNAKTCRGTPVPGWTESNARYEANTAYKASLRAQGLCTNNPEHARPRNGHVRCDACLAKRRKGTS